MHEVTSNTLIKDIAKRVMTELKSDVATYRIVHDYLKSQSLEEPEQSGSSSDEDKTHSEGLLRVVGLDSPNPYPLETEV